MAEKKDTTTPGFDPAEFEAAASRVRELNEKFIDASRKAGNGALDAYEHTLTNMLEMEQKAAGATQLDWIGVMADTHATFVRELSTAYTKAARDLLKK